MLHKGKGNRTPKDTRVTDEFIIYYGVHMICHLAPNILTVVRQVDQYSG